MASDISVLVGTSNGNGEIKSLSSAIQKKGYRVISLDKEDVLWPKDEYVFYKGRYVSVFDAKEFGDGGCFVLAGGFIMVSEQIKIHEEKATLDEIAEYYPGVRAYIVPVGSSKFPRHIDLSVLAIPSRKLMIIDGSHYLLEERQKVFSDIAEAENFTLEIYYPRTKMREFDLFPLNSLVLPKKDEEEIVFANGDDPEFIKLLKKYDVEVSFVGMGDIPKMCGSIGCKTNVYDCSVSLTKLINIRQSSADKWEGALIV